MFSSASGGLSRSQNYEIEAVEPQKDIATHFSITIPLFDLLGESFVFIASQILAFRKFLRRVLGQIVKKILNSRGIKLFPKTARHA